MNNLKKENKHTIKLSIDEIKKFYQSSPKNQKETEFQWIHRMGRNQLVLELIDKLVQKI